jgi:hypothetical protein
MQIAILDNTTVYVEFHLATTILMKILEAYPNFELKTIGGIR